MEIEPTRSDSDKVQPTPLRKIITVVVVAVGVQFGWALQLSLLTPYVQTLGVPYAWASFIWLCSPISNLLVQPIVGFYSDRCTSPIGKCRPFIAGGAVCVCLAVFLIGFAKDIGFWSEDQLEKETKPRAVEVFVLGFWILDVANNMLQGPCRAFLANLSGDNHQKMRVANGFFAFFMAVGNVMGYAAGSISGLYKMFPFTKTKVCNVSCANLKTCFILDVILQFSITIFTVVTVAKKPLTQDEVKKPEGESMIPFFRDLAQTFKDLSKPMWILLLVTSLNWIAWFLFFLFGTDWMGKEVYGGDVTGTDRQKKLYDIGVRVGALGLMLNSIVLGFSSLVVESVGCLVDGVKQVTFSLPFVLASIYCSIAGGGQGLSLGVVNMVVVVPQMFVSVVSGPLNQALGGRNLPAFGMGGIAAIASALLALFLLPNPPPQSRPTVVMAGGH